jgi:hypothetical protein
MSDIESGAIVNDYLEMAKQILWEREWLPKEEYEIDEINERSAATTHGCIKDFQTALSSTPSGGGTLKGKAVEVWAEAAGEKSGSCLTRKTLGWQWRNSVFIAGRFGRARRSNSLPELLTL